ncbi:MAG: alpha/beta hydrolase [Acidobacteriaceae bacterium]
MPKLALNGVSIFYESLGTGSPILFIPGALGTGASDFEHQIGWFSRTHQVIAPDPRGYGQSRPPQRDYPVTFYQRDAEDMLTLMTGLGHEEFTIFGWSDGANIGTLMAANAPLRVRKLVVWGGNSFLSAEEIAAFQAMRSLSSWSQREVDAMRQVYGDSLAVLWAGYVAGLEAIYAAGGEIYRTLLGRVQCPTFVLHGEKDPLVPSFHPRIISEGIAGSMLHVFPEGKHRIHAKYAAEFNQLTAAFI